eukprot:TRINITY_DN77241_c0_g1_i1.p1 TRINITY_DN77241_c0_g1~~TRINITY_DN77241_c0_g1_i1.p1  ORF type:complete len:309 (-),score=38.68 TRINITY_DN77241_c0_g1_i1:155-1081(-)
MAPYGSFGDDKALLDSIPAAAFVTPGKHRRMNLIAILVNLLVPWVYFCFVCWAWSYWPHYEVPIFACCCSVGVGLMIAGFSCYLAYQCKAAQTDPKWYSFFAFAMIAAALFATLLGDMNFKSYMEAVYDQKSMMSYPNINPAETHGQQMMDAGRMFFTEGSGLDLRKSMSFKNSDTYCVAPIVSGEDQLASYDYWAVGVNCCEGQNPRFKCGEYFNRHARAGLRLTGVVNDERRPFYRLAVQQAEAAYNIRAEHPMFFYWVQDPLMMTSIWSSAAFTSLVTGCIAHFLFNSCCVGLAVIVFSKSTGVA